MEIIDHFLFVAFLRNPHVAVHRHGHKLVRLRILKLHDLMLGAGELAPAARFLRVLLNCLILAPAHLESDGFEVVNAGACHGQGLPSHFDRRATCHLRGSRLERQRAVWVSSFAPPRYVFLSRIIVLTCCTTVGRSPLSRK